MMYVVCCKKIYKLLLPSVYFYLIINKCGHKYICRNLFLFYIYYNKYLLFYLKILIYILKFYNFLNINYHANMQTHITRQHYTHTHTLNVLLAASGLL